MATARLSRRLAPSAKNMSMVLPADRRVSAVVTLAPSADRDLFQLALAGCQGSVRSWLPEANLATVEIDAGSLSRLADLAGVVYVEAGQNYSQ